jgi:nucleoside-diphosphate-sugar epimerase
MMRVFIIAGTRFIGPCVVQRLQMRGCEVTLFHRGKTESALKGEIEHIHGDKSRLEDFRGRLGQLRPDVVLHMCAYTRRDAEILMRAMRGVTPRVVVPSSQDVYRAYGRLHKTEAGPIDAIPLTEDSPLREKLSIHGESYEKRFVEQVVMSDPDIAGTILRYPAVYGPGDYRQYELTRRMFDSRPAILLDNGNGMWRWTHAFVDDIAEATALAIVRPEAAGRIYNCGEAHSPRKIERVRQIGRVAGWSGEVLLLPSDKMPRHLREPLAWEQDWVCDTTRIRGELGFAEISDYDEGVAAMLAWQLENPRAIKPEEFDYAAEDDAIGAYRQR